MKSNRCEKTTWRLAEHMESYSIAFAFFFSCQAHGKKAVDVKFVKTVRASRRHFGLAANQAILMRSLKTLKYRMWHKSTVTRNMSGRMIMNCELFLTLKLAKSINFVVSYLSLYV